MGFARAILLLILAFLPTLAHGQEKIGTAVRVVNKVTADQTPLVTGDGVSQNQSIEVAADSLGEIRLNDDTLMALGPGARLQLTKFVYDPGKKSGNIAVQMSQGAFRFITGNAGKKSYEISTPTTVLAIRGTMFDIYIAPDGREWLLLHVGGVEVCEKRQDGQRRCRVLRNPCETLRISPDQGAGEPGVLRTTFTPDNIPFEQAFPFVENPPFSADDVIHTRQQIEEATCPRPYEPQPIRAQYVPPAGTPPVPPAPPAPGFIGLVPSLIIGAGALAADALNDEDDPITKND